MATYQRPPLAGDPWPFWPWNGAKRKPPPRRERDSKAVSPRRPAAAQAQGFFSVDRVCSRRGPRWRRPLNAISHPPSVLRLLIRFRKYVQWKARLHCRKPALLRGSVAQKPLTMTSQPPLMTCHNGTLLIYRFWFSPERTLRGLHMHKSKSSKTLDNVDNMHYH